MNKKTVFFPLTIFMILSAPALSYDAIFDIKGGVQVSTCDYTSAISPVVNLGVHAIGENDFGLRIDSKTPAVDWALTFDCPENVKITVYPRGEAYSSSQNSILALGNDSTAKGLGIETLYNKGTSWLVMPLHTQTSLRGAGEKEGKVTVNFQSYYKQMDAQVTPGKANANLNLEVTYD